MASDQTSSYFITPKAGTPATFSASFSANEDCQLNHGRDEIFLRSSQYYAGFPAGKARLGGGVLNLDDYWFDECRYREIRLLMTKQPFF